MRIPGSLAPASRLATLIAFFGVCALIFGFLWVSSGGELPGVRSGDYALTVSFADVDNLVEDSSVTVAGVRVGKVASLEVEDGRARARLVFRRGPLHEGVQVRLRPRTLAEETTVDIVDGSGPALPSGSAVPTAAVVESVQLDDVLNSLDPTARAALGSIVRQLGAITGGQQDAISALLGGLGALARDGHDTLDILAAQSDDLRALVRHTAALTALLDEGDGNIARLAGTAHRLAAATAGEADAIGATVEALPGLLARAETAAPAITRLSRLLPSIAGDLKAAAPDLNAALADLGPVAAELRRLLPELDAALADTPPTLQRIPPLVGAARPLVPTLDVALADVNPMLAYLQPYGPDLAAFVANFGHIWSSDPNGPFLWAFGVMNDQSPAGVPAATGGTTSDSNAYPRPGASARPEPFRGRYPQIEEER
ncbi:MAG: MlaD family protein [Actinomycetota bacterium]